MKTFLFSLLFSVSVMASQAPLPVVGVHQFTVGNTWFWSYYEKGDLQKWYSTERYRVVELNGTKLSIELWTKYNWATEYTPSAKFTLDLKHCFQAFSGPVKKEFTLKIYAFENGAWSKIGYDVPSVAFEEKFNCNSKVYQNAKDPYQTIFQDLETSAGVFRGFQQLPKLASSQIRSFYFYDHPKLQGIAFKKTFNPEQQDFFEMRLTDWHIQ